MPADPAFVAEYPTTLKFESGESASKFIGTSKPSGEYRFWVIRVWAASEKCLRLDPVKKDRVIFDTIGKGALMNLLDYDKSFMTFERQYAKTIFRLQNDTIVGVAHLYKINGKAIDNSKTFFMVNLWLFLLC
jgi:hypothetical protein